jgi:hypothetical protein
MAATQITAPIANVPASIVGPTTVSLPASSHVNDADIVVLTAGAIATATANVAGGIAGIAQHDSNAVFAQIDTGLQGVFGFFQGAPLLPPDPGYVIVVPLGAPIIVEINLTATTGWVTGGTQQANIGTQVGLAIDGTTGFFLADPTASNKVAVITGKPQGVPAGLGGAGVPFPSKGGVGDTGARVYVSFISTTLAIQQGH